MKENNNRMTYSAGVLYGEAIAEIEVASAMVETQAALEIGDSPQITNAKISRLTEDFTKKYGSSIADAFINGRNYNNAFDKYQSKVDKGMFKAARKVYGEYKKAFKRDPDLRQAWSYQVWRYAQHYNNTYGKTLKK